jgi:hypothetical protein
LPSSAARTTRGVCCVGTSSLGLAQRSICWHYGGRPHRGNQCRS